MAAVAPGARVVDAACGDGRHVVALTQLGFEVVGFAVIPGPARSALAPVVGPEEAARRVVAAVPHALPAPDAWADWVVVAGVPDLPAALAEAARVLAPGGWVWVEADAPTAAALSAGLLEAQEPAEADGRAHAVFRKAGGVG